jgi:hypothetical protein
VNRKTGITDAGYNHIAQTGITDAGYNYVALKLAGER